MQIVDIQKRVELISYVTTSRKNFNSSSTRTATRWRIKHLIKTLLTITLRKVSCALSHRMNLPRIVDSNFAARIQISAHRGISSQSTKQLPTIILRKKSSFSYINMQWSYQIAAPGFYGQSLRISSLAPMTHSAQSVGMRSPRQRAIP